MIDSLSIVGRHDFTWIKDVSMGGSWICGDCELDYTCVEFDRDKTLKDQHIYNKRWGWIKFEGVEFLRWSHCVGTSMKR